MGMGKTLHCQSEVLVTMGGLKSNAYLNISGGLSGSTKGTACHCLGYGIIRHLLSCNQKLIFIF